MTNIDELKRLIKKAPCLPWSGPTDSDEGTHPEEYMFRDADDEGIVFATYYDGPVLGVDINTENLIVLGINALPELIRELEELRNENDILRNELQECEKHAPLNY